MTEQSSVTVRYTPTENLIAELRRAASVWFKNTDLLALEELIRRHEILLKNQNKETT